MFKKKNRGTRLASDSLNSYIQLNYRNPILLENKLIAGFKPFLQENYGGTNDCTLCSISAIASFKNDYQKPFERIYNKVANVASTYCFNSESFGIIPVFIKNIIDKSFHTKSKVRYLKNIGYTWSNLKTLLNHNIPVILSMNNDGRNYYINHSITIVGYLEYTNKCKMLMIYDNWYDTISYIDFNKLSTISCVNYF